ncbi:MAG: hypothetical protein ACRC3B_22965, partial [Bacteroidia bacterium]
MSDQTVAINLPSLWVKSFSSINIDESAILDLTGYIFPFMLNCYGDFQNSSLMRTGQYLFLQINMLAPVGTTNMTVGKNTWGNVFINSPATVNWSDDSLRLYSVAIDRGTINLDVNFMKVEDFFSIGGENTRPQIDLMTSHIFASSIYIFSRGLRFDGDSCTMGVTSAFNANFSSISTIARLYTAKDINMGAGASAYIDLSRAVVNRCDIFQATAMFIGTTVIKHIVAENDLGIYPPLSPVAYIEKADIRALLTVNSDFRIDTLLLNNSMSSTQIMNGKTLSVQKIIAQGSCSAPLTIQTFSEFYFYSYPYYSTTPNTAYISSSSPLISVSGVNMRGISTSGTAQFNASDVFLTGLCNGWNVASTHQSQNLYWVGGSGSWTDPSHWSLTSGGSSSNCTPWLNDNVFFDSNSGLVNNDTVSLQFANAKCHNFSINAPNSNFIFWGNSFDDPLNYRGNDFFMISGSVLVTTPVRWEYIGKVSFVGSERGKTIHQGNLAFWAVSFDQEGAEWSLTDSLVFRRQCHLYRGKLVTNNNFLGCESETYPEMEIHGDTILLGSSTISLPGGNLIVNIVQDTLAFIDAANASAMCLNITDYGIDFDKITLAFPYLGGNSNAYFSTNHFNTFICETSVNLGGFDSLDIDRLICKSAATLPLTFSVGYAEFQNELSLGDSFSFDTLYLNNPSSNVSLPAGKTISANTLLSSTCSSSGPIIYSNASGVQSQLVVPSGTVCM